MREIKGTAQTVRALLKGVKYSIDYYQREYKWQDKQIRELIDDLTAKFLEGYEEGHKRSAVADYPHYFLGSVIISKKDDDRYIVDGQQRLTSLTLLLVLLRHLQQDMESSVNVDELIVSEKYGEKSFNLQVGHLDDGRGACMKALFDGAPFDVTDQSESVRNLYARYHDLEEHFPQDLRDKALPYFVDWLLENVHLVEITAYSDDDAYTIFETMNDRGLSLSPTDMLKGYLLANVSDPEKRASADRRWRSRLLQLDEAGKEVAPDFFKAWFRSQYSTRIRERKKGAGPGDFDRIGTEFHRWLRTASTSVGLRTGDDFLRLIDQDFNFYSRWYLRLIEASTTPVKDLEYVLYNADHGFTLQYMLLLAPLKPDDPDPVVTQKVRLVARYIDIMLAWRLWNFRSTAYSTMQYAMFLVMRDIRRLDVPALGKRLYETLTRETETFASNDRLRVHQQNRYALHRLLARITDYVETQSGQSSRYVEYVNGGSVRYEVEHIWANHPERHTDEFSHAVDFGEHRNRIGGLLLLPKAFNASYGDLTYEEKLSHYNTQNLLARSLHPQCYDHNPGFVHFVEDSGLPFHPHAQFKKADLEERSALYRRVAERVWDPEDLLRDSTV